MKLSGSAFIFISSVGRSCTFYTVEKNFK